MRFAKIYLEITNVCNRGCSFCPKTAREPAFLRVERFAQYAERLRPYTDYLYLHVMGEPLLHPQLDRILDHAGSLGYRVILTTNGTLLQEQIGMLLSKQALHKLNISLHSFEANGPGDLDAYLSRCIAASKRAAASGRVVNLRLWNLDSAAQPGANRENEHILALLHSAFPGEWPLRRGDDCLSEMIYLHRDRIFQWPDLEADEQPVRACYGLKDHIAVLCDGRVVPCCLDHEGVLTLGSLDDQSLDEILAGPRAQAMLRGFAKRHAVEPMCQRCGYATRF